MIAIGSDHGGIHLKAEVMKYLDEKGLEYKDYGTYTEDSCDYPIYGEKVGRAVVSGECERGIIICAEMCRRHNDANILAMGERVLGPGLALKIVETFLNTPFDGGRHARRVALISELEK